ncbi:MAG TPA: siphovirus Gp157 family protein [Terriglobales bacterium]|nr:siphovirus Gp157 family protein [Terriglobales bacterium]
MSAATVITAPELARKASIFEIDEALDLLVQSAEEEAEANNGEITEELRKALVEYVEAFGYKVDRIANYIKAQKAEAETAGREVERLEARRKAAENREKRLKSMLVYYMVTRELRQLRGALNTITLQGNSQPSLVVNDASRMPNVFYRARVDLPWTEWEGILASLPPGALLERLRAAEGRFVQKELQRGVLADAMARGEAIEGATLVKGQHVRVR